MKISSPSKALISIAIIAALLLVATGCQSAEKAAAPSQSSAQQTPSASPADTAMDMSGDMSTDKPVETATEKPADQPATASPAESPTARATPTPAVKPAQSPTPKPAATPAPKPTANPTTAPKPTPAPAAKNYAVEIKDFAFTPDIITVEVNSTITFTNKDEVQHTVTAKDGSFKSGLIDTNKSFSMKFTKAGTYDIYCEPHKFMTAKIAVN